MMKFLFVPILILYFNNILPQEIKINLKNFTNNKAELYHLIGEKISFLDTTRMNSGEFQFNLSSKHAGIYRLTLNNHWIDFVHDNEEIEIETDANNILDSLKVIKSESNKIYYEFVKLNKAYKTKTELLQLILARYPKDDDYYKTTKNKLVQVQEDYLNFVNVLINFFKEKKSMSSSKKEFKFPDSGQISSYDYDGNDPNTASYIILIDGTKKIDYYSFQ